MLYSCGGCAIVVRGYCMAKYLKPGSTVHEMPVTFDALRSG